ncbi:ABC-2 type transporter [Methanothermus fervidus DSM 2088]|uniref:ABC-2 type transporter n=1 Tax=Methanothermus fervidus (strain ATCC 43054 / DSM 2088 / JCM 10308 / V24 S) TaxID=523846 RepID=E3GY29_METFV|nr:ABC transporter permease subunit [Methanothermus fervidus]ADP77211.1 ABC-2 type transporter [Methanothermus fervidus DSM 2088]
MSFIKLAKWEIKNVFKSKKFMILFLLQILSLSMIIFVFSIVSHSFETREVTLNPSFTFVTLGINDPTGLIIKNIDQSCLKLEKNNLSINNVKNNDLTGVLIVNSSSPISLDLFLNGKDPKSIVIKDEVSKASNRTESIILNKIVNKLGISKKIPNAQTISRGEALPVKLINKFMIAILLFLPIFLFGNIIVDNMVGEKERKTIEFLLVLPTTKTSIIFSKSLSALIVIGIQVFIWINILSLLGFKIPQPLLVYTIIIFTAIPIVGVTMLISVFAKNYGEAGMAVTITYIIILGILVIPTILYITNPRIVISPMTLVVKLLSSQPLTLSDLIVPFSLIFSVAFISYTLSIYLFGKDEIIFGPRPSVFKIIWGRK